MNGTGNLEKIRHLYKSYEDDPKKIEDKWINFFNDLDDEAKAFLKNKEIPTNKISDAENNEFTTNSLRARLLIRAYRIAGHLKADLDL